MNTNPFTIEVFSIFPEMVYEFSRHSLVAKALEAGYFELTTYDLRTWAVGGNAQVDDSPYGGGPGMVMRPEPIFRAFEETKPKRPCLFLSPRGTRFDQAYASRLAAGEGFSVLCGRYEGVDQRAVDRLADDEVSIGDFVLAGGEVAAMVIIEAVTRLLDGVVGNLESLSQESFQGYLLEYPHFTRPQDFNGLKVPEVLLSGNHEQITRWRWVQSILTTIERRPDLIEARGGLTESEVKLLKEYG